MRIKKSNKRREILLFPPSLEDMIPEDSVVRLIDAFVDILDMESHGFVINHKEKNEAGAPQYAPSDLLKIYLYGYINRTRSSRRLERCCKINIEVMWLINGLTPGYVTIANFRKNNSKSIKKVFRSYNRFLDNQDLFGKKTIAVDGSKFRGQNAKRNNFTEKSIKRHQDYIDKKIEEYLSQLNQSDQAESQENSEKQIKEKLKQLDERKNKYNQLKNQLDEQEQKQISIIDTDARLFSSIGNKGIVGYNLQSVVDDKNCLIVDSEVTNTGDQNALHKMAHTAKEFLQTDRIDILADSGYDTGEEIMKCTEDDITTYVAPRLQAGSTKKSKFKKDKFFYDKDSDTYTCPEGMTMKTNGILYTKKREGKKDAKFKEYKLSFDKCNACKYKRECAGTRLNRKQSRIIERYVYADYTELNQQRIKKNKNYYRQRASIVEHPFGTIKRQWGYSYTLLKGLEKVGGEFDLICLCYNMRRSVSILGVMELIKRLKASFFEKCKIILTGVRVEAQVIQKEYIEYYNSVYT